MRPAQTVRIAPAGRSLDIETAWVGTTDSAAAPLVFLHEGLGSVAMWKDFPARLCERLGRRGLVYSRFGYGRSTPRPPGERFPVGFMEREAREVLPALLDALGIERAHWVGSSQGGQSSMVAAITYPPRVRKFVMGGSHIGTGGDRYLMANRPSEGSRATRQALDDPTRENIRRYLRVHIDDESLVTDELVDYIHRAHTWSPEFMEARRQSVSTPHDYTPDLASIRAPVLLIHGRYDRMVAFEVSIAILNHIADSRLVLLNNCGHWPPFEKPAEWAAQVLAFLRGY